MVVNKLAKKWFRDAVLRSAYTQSVGVRTSFSTCNVAKYYYSESSQLGDTTL